MSGLWSAAEERTSAERHEQCMPRTPGLIGTARPKDKPEPAHHLTHQTISGVRGKPEDVAATVRFLCSPAARYITGQAIHSNGGAYLGA